MFDGLTIELFLAVCACSLAFVSLGLARYVWRDWDYLSHRWRNRRSANPADTYFEIDAHTPYGFALNPVTQEERDGLPSLLATLAFFGAWFGGHVLIPGENSQWFSLAMICIWSFVVVFIHQRKDIRPVEAGPPRKRWQNFV